MARIAAFRGVRYTLKEVQTCVAPPYDVISSAERDALQEHPYNIIHLTLPEDYAKAKRLWQLWLSQGVLRQESEPCLYLIEQEFTHPLTAQSCRRLALVCLMALEEYEKGVVLPHENTQPRVKEDRLQLLRATEANLEAIHVLGEGDLFAPLNELCRQLPVVTTVEWTDGRHHLRIVSDAETVQRLIEQTASARVWIADGHHRYETCLQYRRERRRAEGNPADDRPYDWMMVALTPLEDPGIVILPTHRVVLHASPHQLQELPRYLARWFLVQSCSPRELADRLHAMPPQKGFAVVTQQGDAFIATLKGELCPEQIVPAHVGKAVRSLEVTLLQTLVLEPVFGITAEHLGRTEGIWYTREEQQAIEKVLKGEAAAAFLLNPPTVRDVRAVALAGERMPPKSTYFYPKLLSGLVMRALAG